MTDSIIRADAVLSARRPGVTASSLRSGVESSLRSIYSVGQSALASVAEFPDEELTPFTLACFLVIAVEFGERFVSRQCCLLFPSLLGDAHCTSSAFLAACSFRMAND